MIEGGSEELLLNRILEQLREKGLIKGHKRQFNGDRLKHHPKFANSNFQIDWSKQVAICPRGHQSKTWTKKTDSKGQPIINIRFDQFNCGTCPSHSEAIPNSFHVLSVSRIERTATIILIFQGKFTLNISFTLHTNAHAIHG